MAFLFLSVNVFPLKFTCRHRTQWSQWKFIIWFLLSFLPLLIFKRLKAISFCTYVFVPIRTNIIVLTNQVNKTSTESDGLHVSGLWLISYRYFECLCTDWLCDLISVFLYWGNFWKPLFGDVLINRRWNLTVANSHCFVNTTHFNVACLKAGIKKLA